MTDEELDEARAKEAQRIWAMSPLNGVSSCVIAARLAREGWTPPDPVLLRARELAARFCEGQGGYAPGVIEGYRAGMFDNSTFLKVALFVLQEGMGN